MKSYRVALFCFLFGGVFGLHHFYLGRNRHGILCLFTFGGFLLGLIDDFMHLRYYVSWANFEKEFEVEYLLKIQRNPTPELGLMRTTIMGIAAQLFALLVHAAIPTDLLDPWMSQLLAVILVPSAVAIAIWYSGSIGEVRTSLWSMFQGALWTAPLYLICNAQFFTTMACVHFLSNSWTYRRRPKKDICCFYKIVYITSFILLIVFLFTSMIMFNCTIEEEGAKPVKCRDVIRNIYHSPFWQRTIEALQDVRDSWNESGFMGVISSLSSLMDSSGEQRALRILGVHRDTSNDDIRKAYRDLSRKYHPDKLKSLNDEDYEMAVSRFIRIQNAYLTLRSTRAIHKDGRRNGTRTMD